MKSIKLFLFIALFMGSVLFIQDVSTPERACAANWGGPSVCANPYGAGYEYCPHGGAAPDHCVTSADIAVTVDGVLIPTHQKFQVTIEPADGSGDACWSAPNTDVSCLNRTVRNYTLPVTWEGTKTNPVVFDTIGCSVGNVPGCTNLYKASLRFLDSTSIDPNITCDNPPDATFTIKNGIPSKADFFINCRPIAQCPGTCGTSTYPQGQACTISGNNGTWQYDGKPANSSCSDRANAYCYACIPKPTSTPVPTPTTPVATPTTPPGVTTTPTPPGVTTTPTSTPIPSTCPVPGTPVVTVTCIGCNNDDAPTATPTNGLVSTPTPTGKANITPTDTVRITITPTPTGAGNKDTGATCNANSECKSNSCIKNSNSRTGFCR